MQQIYTHGYSRATAPSSPYRWGGKAERHECLDRSLCANATGSAHVSASKRCLGICQLRIAQPRHGHDVSRRESRHRSVSLSACVSSSLSVCVPVWLFLVVGVASSVCVSLLSEFLSLSVAFLTYPPNLTLFESLTLSVIMPFATLRPIQYEGRKDGSSGRENERLKKKKRKGRQKQNEKTSWLLFLSSISFALDVCCLC